MLKCRAASRWLMPSAQARRTFLYMSTVMILPPSLQPAGRTKVDDYCAARSGPTPPLPWPAFSPPFSFFDQIVEAAISDAELKQAAAVNPGDKFELVFKNLLEALFVERMDQNEEIFARFMNDRSFQKVVTGWLSSEAYRKLNSSTGS
jgi:hypothetical protein